ncbi:MAG: trypsin-like peptidase domain-containing protein [Clostridiales bacterium]|nr:trypsin-like peptidase domain-containing protein [Clostridiales bacterium]
MHTPDDEYYDYKNFEFEPNKKPKVLLKIVSLIIITVLALTAVFGIGYFIGVKGRVVAAGREVNKSGGYTLLSTDSSGQMLQGNTAVNVIDQVSNSVVSINANVLKTTPEGSFPSINAGSGIIISEDGSNIYIVTNNHVISDALSISISLDDNIQVEANVIGRETLSDLAVISVLKSELEANGVKGYTIANFADSLGLRVGEDVIAIGNAAGEGKSATKGIISALNKTIQVDGKELNVLQTDSAINPGNSGGALVGMDGLVVGVNTAKYSNSGREGTDRVEGMGYAIPSNEVRSIIEGIIQINSETPEETEVTVEGAKPSLGVGTKMITEEQYNSYGIPVGLYITDVYSKSNAEAAGLKNGDVIVSYNGRDIKTMGDLKDALDGTRIGQTVTIGVYRDGQLKNISVQFTASS